MSLLTPILRLDARLFELIHIEAYHPFWLQLFGWLTWLGNGLVLFALLVPLLAWLDRRRLRSLLIALALALAVGGALVQVVKHSVDRPRPASRFGKRMHIGQQPPRHRHSFPSGHANTAFAAAAFVWALHRGLGAALFSVAFLVGFSRVYVGAHYPADVIVGAALGILCGWVAVTIWKRKMGTDVEPDHHTDVQ